MLKVIHSIGRLLGRLSSETHGGALIYTAILVPTLIGFVGLGIDVALWHVTKRQTQTMADAGAVSVAIDYIRNDDFLGMNAAAERGATANGYDGNVGNLVVRQGPASGDFAGDLDFVEVVVDMPAANLFSALFLTSNNIQSRAVVRVGGDPGDPCMLSLNPDVSSAITITGNTGATLDCPVAANSTADDAFDIQSGSACFNAPLVTTVGGINEHTQHESDPLCDFGENPNTEVPINDPLIDVFEPAIGSCPVADAPVSGVNGDPITGEFLLNDNGVPVTFPTNPLPAGTEWDPGYLICGTLVLTANSIVTFRPGLYVFSGPDAGLEIEQSTVFAENVTFYFGPDTKGVRIVSGATGSLSATGLILDEFGEPDEDAIDPDNPYNGVLFFDARERTVEPDWNPTVAEGEIQPPPSGHVIEGHSGITFGGINYFPDAHVRFAGTGDSFGSALIADTITLTGDSTLGSLNSIIFDNFFDTGDRFVELVE